MHRRRRHSLSDSSFEFDPYNNRIFSVSLKYIVILKKNIVGNYEIYRTGITSGLINFMGGVHLPSFVPLFFLVK